MANRLGQQFGNYRLVRLLGEGGFAEVYLAEHIHLGTQAAIKVLHAQLMSVDLDKFRSEARTLANLVHPHIVRVLDFGVEGGTPFLVMDYARNGTLRQRHPKGTILPLPTIVSYVKQVAEALQYAHDEKLVHRDVKPENMLVGRHDDILLSDFGIATIAHRTTTQRVEAIAGTDLYMAPELFKGKPRPSSDQYSLAIVVYEWLCGEPPFNGDFWQLAYQHTHEPPPPLHEKTPSILPDVEQVVMVALAKDPKDRFMSVKAFSNALEQASPSASVQSQTLSMPPSPVSKPLREDSPVSRPLDIPAAIIQPTQSSLPPPSSPLSRPLPTVPYTEGPALYTSQPILQVGQTTGSTYAPSVRKAPNFGLILGTVFLLLVLIGGSIFFFTRSSGTGSNVGSSGGNSGGNTGAIVNGKGCEKIGVLLPETSTSARWEGKDRPLLQQDISAALPAGSTIDFTNAELDPTKQQSQAEADLTKGDCILVVAAVDSDAAAAIVAKAKPLTVPVIAYDRLIQSKDLAYYVSFDNVKVGELQGQYIVDHNKDFVSPGHNNLVMINGSQTDNNALLFARGAHNKLDPIFNNGTLKKVYEQFTPDWNNDTARTEMDGALTANSNNVQVAYVANDGMANTVIASLKAQGLNGKVLVTGQDATVAGLQNILTGDQAMTVYKAIAKEAQATADLVKALYNGSDTSSLTNGATTNTSAAVGGVAIPSILETPVVVDKTNINSTVIADGFVTKDEVCQGLPAGTGGLC